MKVLLATADIQEKVDANFLKCRAHEPSTVIAPCDKLLFTDYLLKEQASFKEAVEEAKKSPSGGGESELTVVAAPSFQEFFTQHEVAHKPAVLIDAFSRSTIVGAALSQGAEVGATGEVDMTADLKDAFTKIAACASAHGSAQNGVSETSVIKSCPGILDSTATMPKYVMNDFMQRLPADVQAARVKNRASPIAITAAPGSTQAARSCPHGQHQLLAILEGSLDVKVYGADERHKVYAVPGPAWHAAAADPFSAASATTHPLLSYARAAAGSLEGGDLLFVPGGSLAAWKATGTAKLVALRFCYVDASNFVAVRHALRPLALTALDSRRVLAALAAPGFDTRMSRTPGEAGKVEEGADLADGGAAANATAAAAAELTWASYQNWPPASMEGDSEGGKPLTKKQKLERKAERKKGGRKGAFQKWQEDKKWHWEAHAMTLPSPKAPVVRNWGRTNASLQWESPLRMHSSDTDTVGFRITWAVEGRDTGRVEAAAGGAEAAVAEGGGWLEVNSTDIRRSVESAVANHDKAADGKMELLEQVVQALQPNTTYSFTVSVYVGKAVGEASDPSLPVTTAPLTAPSEVYLAPVERLEDGAQKEPQSLRFSFPQPVDDGGQPITHFVLAVRRQHALRHSPGSAHPQQLPLKLLQAQALRVAHENARHRAGDTGAATMPGKDEDEMHIDFYVRILSGSNPVVHKLTALVPDTAYMVKVCAVNKVGHGQWSALSAPTTTQGERKAKSANAHVFGAGHFSFGSHHFHSVAEADADADGAEGTLSSTSSVFDLTGVDSAALMEAATHENSLASHPRVDPRKRGVLATISDTAQTVQVFPHKTQRYPVDVWTAHHSPQHHDVTAEVLFADPPHADVPGVGLNNSASAFHRILAVRRGKVPVLAMAHTAQRAGAIGLIVADDGRCDGEFDQHCAPGADKSRSEGFAQTDLGALWETVHIPVVLMHQEQADELEARCKEEDGLPQPAKDKSPLQLQFAESSERGPAKKKKKTMGGGPGGPGGPGGGPGRQPPKGQPKPKAQGQAQAKKAAGGAKGGPGGEGAGGGGPGAAQPQGQPKAKPQGQPKAKAKAQPKAQPKAAAGAEEPAE
jgi:hypothetical protein